MAARMTSDKNSSGGLARKLYNPMGFTKAYNFWLWLVFAGALTGFCLARFMYLNFHGIFCPSSGPTPGGKSAAPGECYYYLNFDRYKVGILLHLTGVLPASLLAVVQFTPFIRKRWIMVHRITGYAAILLYTVSLVGAFMIARHAFGGGMDVQVWVGFVGIGVLVCLFISYINIRKLQIEQHRAWMLRGWFYAGSIITNRIITIIATQIISNKGYFVIWPCAKIEATLQNTTSWLDTYPSCVSYADGTHLDQVSTVEASFGTGGAPKTGAALGLNFGMALWLAIAIHAIGVEIYLQFTPEEAQRLRQVGYQR
ncbi:hypothetical protein T440DRAFT_545307 [Plenodomus tracheiphilus IPT5]|uniref:DUF2306 domain-containing protein n=1 Tax=Plenodomus tracheiphilus IPT5 TaxID=1408161 RepID=A0A6A7ASK6_9PLEO|nr:hypothetical protein T440DRAFT_545307 [Plenodomus tracheiphilus IPT5]